MRALEIGAYDSHVRLVERPIPNPKKGEVLVRIAASSINPSDLMFLRGDYGTRKKLPVVPGFEASGTVVASGKGIIERTLVGRQVACGAPDDGDGTWAEYMVTPWNRCVPIVVPLSVEQSAMLLVNPLTAISLLEIARRGHHRTIVQTAAAGELGRMIIALARRNKMATINIVRRPQQVQLLKSLGAEHVLDTSQPAFEQTLQELCQVLEATIAFETVAGNLTGKILSAMPSGSKLILVGNLSQEMCSVDPHNFIFENKRMSGFWLAQWFPRQNILYQLYTGIRAQVLVARELESDVSERLSLEEAVETLNQDKLNQVQGKVLILPGEKENG